MQANHYDKFFQPQLHKAGYDSVYKRKTREAYGTTPNAMDGCAIFYRRERFAMCEQYQIEYDEAAKHTTNNTKALRRLMKVRVFVPHPCFHHFICCVVNCRATWRWWWCWRN